MLPGKIIIKSKAPIYITSFASYVPAMLIYKYQGSQKDLGKEQDFCERKECRA